MSAFSSDSAIVLMKAGMHAPTVDASAPAAGRDTPMKGASMPICLIVENPEQTSEQAERVFAHVRSTGPVPPKALASSWPGQPSPAGE